MNYFHKFLIFLTLLLPKIIHCELLIVQQQENTNMPLSAEILDKYGEKIAAIKLKYQWPTCVASDLTPQEINELFTLNVANAEAIFVQKKINALFTGVSTKPRVLFVPQSLYDKFCLTFYLYTLVRHGSNDQVLKEHSLTLFLLFEKYLKETGFDKNYSNLLFDNPYSEAITECLRVSDVNLTSILNIQDSSRVILKKINEQFDKVNQPFFKGSNNAVLYMNNIFLTWLFWQCPDLQKYYSISTLEHKIEGRIEQLILALQQAVDRWRGVSPRGAVDEIIKQVISVEYEANRSNQAMLLRGTRYENFQFSKDGKIVQQKLIGNTLHFQDEQNFLKRYATKNNQNYSISFGTTLFGGRIQDPGACAYEYLKAHVDGYAILIDKKEYFLHRLHRLFFIPPLAAIAAPFAGGEYFHPRTTVATQIDKKSKETQGLYEIHIADPTGVIIINRDPLHHAQLFSNYLAQHVRLITNKSPDNLAPEGQQFFDDVRTAQRDAAIYYKFIRDLKSRIDKAAVNFKTFKQEELKDLKFQRFLITAGF